MLTTLIIKDFAIIDRLELGFEDGMSVLSGETGAGKSIVINALNLLLGGRASTDVIRTSAEEAVVEGAFELRAGSDLRVRARLEELGVPCEDGVLVVRRVVNRTGRNKVIINGSLATLTTLRELMRGMVDISGQHEHYSLLDTARHVHLLDRFGDLGGLMAQVARGHRELQALEVELDELRARARDRLARIDYLSFQLEELDNANLRAEEEAELDAELGRLSNAESLREATQRGMHVLYEDEGSVCERIDQIARELGKAGRQASEFAVLSSQLGQARAIIDDVVHELRALSEVEDDPRRLDEVQRRLAVLDRLKRKFGLEIGELIAEMAVLRSELDSLQGAESRIDEIAGQHRKLGARTLELARELSRARRLCARELEGRVERELALLGMASCVFRVAIESQDEIAGLRSTGIDRVEFLLAPNPGEQAKALARIASGGELSRVMLAIKQVFATTDEVSTYIFDEVDAGIGGAVAEQVARSLRKVSAGHQVLCITHLATIASYADHHFAVSKRVEGERTVSEICRLGEDERIREIARMLGGLSITERSLEHAAEMVERAQIPVDR